MQQMSLGNLSFIVGPTPNGAYGVTVDPNVQGLDAPDYRLVQYPIPGQDYARVASNFYDARTITLTGLITGQTPAAYQQNRAALSSATLLQRDSNGYPVTTKLLFTTMDGNQYFCNVIPKKPIFAHTMLTHTKYQLSLVAPDARIYGVGQQSSGNITTLVGGGFIVPTVVPVVGSGSSGGSAAVTNSGNVESHPIITFVGPLTNPYIQNQATGYAFQIDYTITGGNSVVVDMYNKTVVLDGSQNLISTLDATNNYWWTIQPGQNTIQLSTSNSSDGGYVQVSFYSAYNGV